MRTAALLALLLVSAGLAPAARAEDWPAWRGPRGDGTSRETDLPTKWSDAENVAWKAPVPGTGHSSPVVLGDRVFLTSALEDKRTRVLICLDRRDGKRLWETTVLSAPLEGKHQLNSYASSTPATDGKHLFVSFLEQPKIQLVCYDLDGKEVWRKSPGTFSSIHGFCSSPLLYKDLVILNCDQDADAWIVAYDKATGAERWRTDRPNKTRSYCTPLVIEAAGKTQMVLTGSKSVASYDPDTGKQHWVIDGPTEQFVAGVAYAQGVVFATGGYPELHVLGIDPSGSGNVTKTHVRWRDHRRASYVPSPVAHDRWFFLVSDKGFGTCFDATTGEVKWKERLGPGHSASAVCGGGHVYFVSDEGDSYVVRAGPEYELVSQNTLGEPAFATPAISRGQIFIRTTGHLWCIGKPDAAAAANTE
jgi:outer membrane protein assembly factor BamB